MAEQATQTIIVEATPQQCYEVICDFTSYPEWAKDVKQADVLERDEQGRALEVEFRAAAMGRSTHYTLRYDHSAAPERVSWKLSSGDLMRACDGSYDLKALEGGRTEVIYEMAVELVVPLPGFVKRRAEVRILNTVRELKTRVEAITA